MEQITREPASCCRCLSYTRLKVVWRRPGHDWIQGLAVTLRFKPLLSKRAFGTVAFFWARRIINKTQAGEIHMKSLWAATMNPRLWWKLLHFCFKKENCFLSESCLHAELKSFPEAPSAQCKPSVTIVSNSINLSCISAPLYAETVLCLNIDWMHFNPIITFNPKKWQIQRGSFGLIGRKGLIAVQSRDRSGGGDVTTGATLCCSPPAAKSLLNWKCPPGWNRRRGWQMRWLPANRHIWCFPVGTSLLRSHQGGSRGGILSTMSTMWQGQTRTWAQKKSDDTMGAF